MAEFLIKKYKNNNFVNNHNDIINLLLKKLKNEEIFDNINDNNNDNNNFYPSDLSTKIVTTTEVKPLSNSNDYILQDDNNIYNNEIKNNNCHNIKEIPQENENEYNYEPTDLSFVYGIDFRKILDENKFKQFIEQIIKHEKIILSKIENEDKERSDEYDKNNKNKKEKMEVIIEDDDESKYDQDSLKVSRKSSNLIRLDNINKSKNSMIIFNKNNSQNYEVNNNRSLINETTYDKNKDFLSLSANNINNIDLNGDSSSNNKIKIYRLENHNVNSVNSNLIEDLNNKNIIKTVDGTDFFRYTTKNNTKEPEIINNK